MRLVAPWLKPKPDPAADEPPKVAAADRAKKDARNKRLRVRRAEDRGFRLMAGDGGWRGPAPRGG